MKTYTDKKAAMYCNRVLSAARGIYHKEIWNAWLDADGRTNVCDGFRAYRLLRRPDGLSTVLTVAPRFCKPIDLTPVFQPLDLGDVVSMPAPVETDVDAVRRYKSTDSRVLFDLGVEFPAVNGRYLWEIMQLLPGAKWFCLRDPRRRMLSPVYAVSDAGSACLLPIRTYGKALHV